MLPILNAAPGFSIALAGGGADVGAAPGGVGAVGAARAAAVEGEVGLRVELDGATRLRLLEQRFEVVAYVDFELVGEQEQGYSPFTYVLDTKHLSNGPHVVTINVAGMQDQLAARSLVLNVANSVVR